MEAQIRHFTVHKLAIGLTVLAILSGLAIPKQWTEMYLVLFGVVLILAGVPHGASDYLLFRQLSSIRGGAFQVWRFFTSYLVLIVAYLMLWWLMPIVAFLLFLILSAYHFGQSNWPHIHFSDKFSERLTMFLWGAAVIGIPVLLHFDQASTIVLEMTGMRPFINDTFRAALIFLLLFGCTANMLHLHHQGVISKQVFVREMRNFLLLMLLFFTTPLLVGFGVYFVLWHSLGSMLDQISVLRSIRPGFGIKNYLLAAIPLSIVAFAGLGLLYFFLGDYFDEGQNLGVLFLFVSVITVPHAFLMEWLYKVGSPVLEQEREAL